MPLFHKSKKNHQKHKAAQDEPFKDTLKIHRDSNTNILVHDEAASDASGSHVTIQTTSSSTANHSPSSSSSENSSSKISTSHFFDPYADFRDRMEALSLHNKMLYVYHDEKAAESLVATDEDSASLVSSSPIEQNIEPIIPFFVAWTTYFAYAVFTFVGHIRELCARLFNRGRYLMNHTKSNNPSDDRTHYAPLLQSFKTFYTKRIYHRIQDCFNRPICTNPGAHIHVLERISQDGNKTMQVLGSFDDANLSQDLQKVYTSGKHFALLDKKVTRKCLNLGSYNYLGFGDDWNVSCQTPVLNSLKGLPVSMGSSRLECGTSVLHSKVEQIIAEFLNKEAALAMNMGFNTNATTIPALVGSGDLIVSDELNHTSIVNGARTSGAAIRCFRHNDSEHLEEILKEAIVLGQPRTRRPWKKIMVIVEGIYSMEGEYCDLRSIVKVCKKYGAYVYLDEAHSIGAMGATGRGCCEYTGVDTKDVDIMMGTFTKSFGGMGGYIAANKAIIDMLRKKCAGSSYHNSLSPVVCQQVITSFEVIMGRDGTNIGKQKIQSLRDNSNYFRMRLNDMGLQVLGHYDSPIIPVMLYNPAKIAAFSRESLKRGLAVVVVGFPAVPILMSRVRFCISASHSREDLDIALREIEEIADLLNLRYARSSFG